MIGYIASDCGTLIEFWPIYGSDKGIPNWTQIRIRKTLPSKAWGEYGFAFSGGGTWRDLTLWISWSGSDYPWDFDRLARLIKKKLGRDL